MSSAELLSTGTSTSSSGSKDGLGRRVLRFDREAGVMLEVLVLRPELGAFETMLRERVERVAGFADERLARPRAVARNDAGSLTVVSEFVPGIRLSELLEQSEERGTAPGVDAALGFLLEILHVLCGFHAATGLPHGTIAPERIVGTPAGKIVLLDAVYAGPLTHLLHGHRKPWEDFGLATPPSAVAPRLDAAADIAQAALTAVMLIVGRRLRGDDYPDGLVHTLRKAGEVAHIRGGQALADAVAAFLTRALPLAHNHPYATADEALLDVRQAAGVIGVPTCRRALADFVLQAQHHARDGAASADMPALPSAVAPPATPRPEPSKGTKGPMKGRPAAVPQQQPRTSRASDAHAPAAASPAGAAVERATPDRTGVVVQGPGPVPPQCAPACEPPVPDTRSAQSRPRPARPSTPEPPPVQPPYRAPAVPVARGPLAVTQPAPSGTLPAFTAAQLVTAPAATKIVPLKLKEAAATPRASQTPAALDIYAPAATPAQTHRRRVPWTGVAATVALLVAATLAARAYLPLAGTATVTSASVDASRAGDAPLPAAGAVARTGRLEVKTEPAGARILLDGQPAGESPTTLDDIPAGRHDVRVISSSGSVQRTIYVEPGRTTRLNLPIFSGWVGIFVPFVVEVSEGDQLIGTTEEPRLMISAGPHELTLTNRELGYQSVHAVDIQPGETRSISLDPRGTVNLNASPWAEVWIDGEKVGETPVANLQVRLGHREFVFRHPDIGERRATMTVRADTTGALSVDMRRPGP